MHCRLCPDTRFRTGVCVDPITHDFVSCALERGDCENGLHSMVDNKGTMAKFQSALHAISNHKECLVEVAIRVGKCSSGSGEWPESSSFCTPRPLVETCPNLKEWNATTEECNLYSDKQDIHSFTYFGYCQNNNSTTTTSTSGAGAGGRRCVWDELECDWEGGKVYHPPQRWPNLGPSSNLPSAEDDDRHNACLCEHVQTSVCAAPQYGQEDDVVYYYCAVSPRACDDPTTFVRAVEVAAHPKLYRDLHGRPMDYCRLWLGRPAAHFAMAPPSQSPTGVGGDGGNNGLPINDKDEEEPSILGSSDQGWLGEPNYRPFMEQEPQRAANGEKKQL
ncbi:hypothetical protein ACA910_021478 [Epithemia clementina (nom. ined.)]